MQESLSVESVSSVNFFNNKKCCLYNIVYSVQCKVYSVQCKVYIVYLTAYSVNFSAEYECGVSTYSLRCN